MANQSLPSIQTSDPEAHEITPTNPTNPSSTSFFKAKDAVKKLKNNLVFRSKWAELNGAMGDLGTYIPIVLALTLARDLNLGTTLIFN
ncbi:molybdate transporter 1-like, partial [Trifolium medium]|nr:molybdate transporter 1-like [Trifolium medium]